jgi:hypothetical protein
MTTQIKKRLIEVIKGYIVHMFQDKNIYQNLLPKLMELEGRKFRNFVDYYLIDWLTNDCMIEYDIKVNENDDEEDEEDEEDKEDEDNLIIADDDNIKNWAGDNQNFNIDDYQQIIDVLIVYFDDGEDENNIDLSSYKEILYYYNKMYIEELIRYNTDDELKNYFIDLMESVIEPK